MPVSAFGGPDKIAGHQLTRVNDSGRPVGQESAGKRIMDFLAHIDGQTTVNSYDDAWAVSGNAD